jgi:hypothetical protein
MSNKDYETLTDYETSDEETKTKIKVYKDEKIDDELNEIKVDNFDKFNEIKVDDDLQLSELKPMTIEDLINRKNFKEISEDVSKDINKDISKDINKETIEESNNKQIVIFKNEIPKGKKIIISNRSLLLIK